MFLLDAVKNDTTIYTCGATGLEFAGTIPYIVHLIVTIIKIGVPVLLVIWGMFDLGKAVVSQKEDDIKKGQQMMVKRLIAAVLVFFVFFITQTVVGLVAGKDKDNITNCMQCFLNGDCTVK